MFYNVSNFFVDFFLLIGDKILAQFPFNVNQHVTNGHLLYLELENTSSYLASVNTFKDLSSIGNNLLINCN